MIKFTDWKILKSNVADYYTREANAIVDKIAVGGYREDRNLRFIILTRYVKALDLQNVKEDDVQIADGFKDYDEDVIDLYLRKINSILGTTFNVPIVYHAVLDAEETV